MITLPSAKGRTYGIIKDPYYSAVSLLLHMNGANGSTTFTDSSLNNLTVTPNGSIAISTTQSKFGGASAYFDGTGDYLSFTGGMPSGAGTEFTIECWVRLDDLADYRMITRTVGGIDFYVVPDGSISVGRSGVVGIAASATGLITAGTWYHIALTRDTSNNYKIYINGVQVASGTNSFSVTAATTIGYSEYSGSHYFKGYIDDLRITKGVSRYNSNFTPPIRPYPDYEEAIPADPYYSSTSLLLHMDGTNGSTSFIDSGPNALTVTAAANAQISTTQSKYGGSAGYFDGTGDYLTIANYGSLFTFGTGDFTVEAWVYVTSSGTSFSFLLTEGFSTDFAFYVDNTRLGMWDGASSSYYSSADSVPLNQWVHVAFSRSGGFIRGFVNGVLTGSVSNSRNMTNSQAVRVVASSTYPNSSTCYVDELRVTKGVARFTSNFTPPTKAYPNVYNPYASLPVNGAILWLDASKHSSLFTDAGSTNVKNNGDLVYQWNDLSGANNHATQSTSGSRPTWSPPASGQNGLGAIRFNRADSQWMMDQMASVTIGSIYFVYYHSTGNALYSSFIASSTAAGPLPASDIEFRFAVPAGNYDSFVALHSHNFSSISSRINNSAVISNFYNYIYGQEINTSNRCQLMSFTMTPKSGSMNLVLGQDAAPLSGRFSNMKLCEIIIFPSQHSQEQIDSMESYLKAKWGTA